MIRAGGDLARWSALLAAVLFAASPIVAQSSPSGTAARVYERACDAGDREACSLLGLMNEAGQGIPRDLDRARELYGRACDGGEPAGCSNLGRLDNTGPGDSTGTTLRPYLKLGRVTDAEGAGGLSDAVVTVPELGIQAVSDAEGRVALGPIPAGRHSITAERLGYERWKGTLEMPGNGDFLIPMTPAAFADPSEAGRIEGRITDGESGQPLSDVEAAVAGPERAQTVSDQAGGFEMQDVKPGLVQVRLTRLGYAPRTLRLVVQPGGTGQLAATMSVEAIELPAIDVTTTATASSSAYLERTGFNHRKLRGFGRQYTQDDLDEIHAFEVSDAVQHVPGVRLVYGRFNTVIASTSRSNSLLLGGCTLTVYIDGVRMWSPDLNQIAETSLAGLEVYVGNDVPIEYAGTGACGIVLMWTKR